MKQKLHAGLIVALGLAVSGMALAAQQRPARSGQQQRPVQHAPAHPPQRGSAPGVGGGHIPAAPPKRPSNAPSERMIGKPDVAGHPVAPHVDAKGDTWVGRSRPNSPRYHLDHPWEHGHFPGTVGQRQIWRLEGGGPSRFWFGGYAFMVAEPDWTNCNNWLWDSDDIVLYLDPDQPGWYIAYDARLGTWAHVEYLGPM